MEEQSSRSPPGARRTWSIAAVLAIAVFGVGAGVAVAGRGSDDNNSSGDVEHTVRSTASSRWGDSVQESDLECVEPTSSRRRRASRRRRRASSTQVHSVQSQISTATRQPRRRRRLLDGAGRPQAPVRPSTLSRSTASAHLRR